MMSHKCLGRNSRPNENISTVLSFCQEVKKVNEISVEIASVLPSFEPGTLQIQLWSVTAY
jgi:hypothetical protein